MTIPQEFHQEFEVIAEKIIKKLLEGVDTRISRTAPRQDGGYDIVVQCYDGIAMHKLYFECKLRSGNLNLRDIAANVIIAYNEGAIGLIALTNYDYTPQLESHIGQFYQKTILNIKIIIGSELHKIVTHCDIKASDELLSILKEKKTKRQKKTSLLRIDFSKEIYPQLFAKKMAGEEISSNYLSTVLQDSIDAAAGYLRQGYTIAVNGYAGVGKSAVILSMLANCIYRPIHIDAQLYHTQEQLLLELLLQLWGIPEKYLIAELTDEHVNEIASLLNGEKNDLGTEQIIKALLIGKSSENIHNIQYNYRVCKYLLSLLELHKDNIKYAFYIDNLQFANEEVFELLKYLIKLLHKQNICCIVERTIGEYALQSGKNLDLVFLPLTNYYTVNIDVLDAQQAKNFLLYMIPQLSAHTAQMIVRLVGCRIYNLALTIRYLERRGVNFDNPRNIALELNMLTPNDIPNIISKVLPFYRQQKRPLFDLLVLLRCAFPYEFLEAIHIDPADADDLIDEQILSYKQGLIVPSNEFVWRELLNCPKQSSISQRRMAEVLLQYTDQNPIYYQSFRILLLYNIENYSDALSALNYYTTRLRKERQYSTLIRYLDLAIEITEKTNDINRRADYIVEQLDVIILKKEIDSKKANQRILELHNLLQRNQITHREIYQIAYDFFVGKRLFKSGHFDLTDAAVCVNAKHYELCINGTYLNNSGDWLGKACSNYALFIKESCGNAEARIVFENALHALPDSFALQCGFYSHDACMKLYNNPIEAHKLYQKIIELYDEQPAQFALPFHEYGDTAMSLLLAGKAGQALECARQAIELADSYGVLDEVGRITNIEGCARLCLNDIDAAEELFIEATALMEHTRYRLYCWRSRLNEIQIKLERQHNQNQLSNFLEETYFDFRALLGEKICKMAAEMDDSFFETREYHALLIFGKAYRALGFAREEEIIRTFNLTERSKIYLDHVEAWITEPFRPIIEASPYFCGGRIFMIG